MALEDRNVAAEHCKEEQYPFQPDKFLKEANSECQEKKVLPHCSDESDREELITDFQTGKWMDYYANYSELSWRKFQLSVIANILFSANRWLLEQTWEIIDN